MNMVSRMFAVTFLVILIAGNAHASGYLTGLQQGVPVTSYMMNNGVPPSSVTGMTLWVSGIDNPDSCGGTDKVFIRSDTPNYKSLVAAVLAAVATGQKLGFWSSGCEIQPFWGGTTTYPVVYTLWVVD